jgi:AAA domain-containing protein/DNA primase RepB-like protein
LSNLPVIKQLSLLRRVWGGDSHGYVFVPWLPGHLKTRRERMAPGAWQEVCFKWPEDSAKIRAHLEAHENDDVYFCPNLFDQPHRTTECLSFNQRALYADLDAVDPDKIEADLRPTIAWQTSDGSYQAVWLLGEYGLGISDEGNENHRLTVYLGADKTGWDSTQLLRVPGRKNFKPGKKGQQGKLLWDNGPLYGNADDFAHLPEVRVVDATSDEVDDALLGSIDRKAVWRRVRMKVSTRCRDYMGIRTVEAADDAASNIPEGMSGLMWYVERELADAGCSLAEIIALVRPMPWNKFAGRRGELTRLKREAAKAIAERGDGDSSDALEDVEEVSPDVFISLDEFLSQNRPRPRWLIDKIWARGTVGFIAGAPKSYKSWIALDMALSVATGTAFLGEYKCEQGKVLYVQEEDSDVEVLDRAGKVFQGKPREIHPWGYMNVENGEGSGVTWSPPSGERLLDLAVRKGLDLTSEGWQGVLAEYCEENEPVLVIIDTLGTTSGEADTDKSREVNRALKPLKVLAQEYGCAIAIVHHFSKAGVKGDHGTRGGSKMLGSVAIHAWAENGLYVGEKTQVRQGLSRVVVERESKRAQDLRFGVEIPEMGRMHSEESGERVGVAGWQPIIVSATHSEVDEPSSSGRVNGTNAGHVNGSVVGQNGKTPAWRRTVMKLAGGGATKEQRALSNTEIRERLFGDSITRQALDTQLRQAIAEGLVEKTADKRYWVVAKL